MAKDNTAADPQNPPGEPLAKAVCGGCNTEQVATHKHCCECGGTLAKATDIDAALGVLRDFAKARQALAADPEPKAESAAGDPPGQEILLTKAAAIDDESETDSAIVGAILAGQNQTATLVKAIADHVRQILKDDGVVAKAMADAIGGIRDEVSTMRGAIEAWANAPARSRAATVVPFAKSIATPTSAGQQDDSPKGDLLVKAAINAEVKGLAGSGDATLTQMYVNRGLSLAGIAEADPALARRLTRAFAQTESQTAAAAR